MPDGKIYVLTRGGFGNVLFNFLIGWTLAKIHQMSLYFIPQSDGKRPPMNSYDIFQGYSYTSFRSMVPNPIGLREIGFAYRPIPDLDPERSYLLDGYFQSYKYSESHLDEIKAELWEKIPEKLARIQEIYASLKREKETILVHVRRGDYLNLPDYHPTQSNQYYLDSLKIITQNSDPSKFKLLICSDDLSFVQNWEVLKDWDFEIVQLTDTIETFILMSLADNFIISNSTYSLLAYYFRDQKEAPICAPSRWFGPKGPKFQMTDLLDLSNPKIRVLSS